MAESFFTIIDRGTMEVNHIGEDAMFTLPEKYQELKGILEDKEAVKAWIEKHDLMMLLFYKFLQKDLIDCRATVRPAVKVFSKKEDFDKAVKELKNPADWHIIKNEQKISKRMLACVEECQKRLDEKAWDKLPTRPGTTGAKASKAAVELETITNTVRAMKASGIDSATVKQILSTQFDTTKIAQALNTVESEND